ncbi:hypothetical protein LX36DRAFT_664373 [Colletotrichum falcatum]|nr:hypothetical protein LX36DRAFT_664373 [Colletotrichum falcatum]
MDPGTRRPFAASPRSDSSPENPGRHRSFGAAIGIAAVDFAIGFARYYALGVSDFLPKPPQTDGMAWSTAQMPN